ncbi:MAG: bile acid:sodium symporter family protein [Runella sp.]
MQNSSLLSNFLPIALGIIMLGLGLSLTLDDFRRVVRYPKAMAIALVCQMILLPVVCFGIAKVLGLPPALAVGLMLLAASPGGATANLYSHLSEGDVALNITLTAVNSLLTLFTLPLIVNFSIEHFMAADQHITMQFKKILEVFGIVLVPVSIGMLIRAKIPAFAARMDKPVKIASALLLVMVIALLIYQERTRLGSYIEQVGLAVLVFNILSMVIGYWFPQWLGVGQKQAIAIGMEIGIHNATLAIYIALNVLKDNQMSIPPGLYGIIMFFTAAVFGYWVRKRIKSTQ